MAFYRRVDSEASVRVLPAKSCGQKHQMLRVRTPASSGRSRRLRRRSSRCMKSGLATVNGGGCASYRRGFVKISGSPKAEDGRLGSQGSGPRDAQERQRNTRLSPSCGRCVQKQRSRCSRRNSQLGRKRPLRDAAQFCLGICESETERSLLLPALLPRPAQWRLSSFQGRRAHSTGPGSMGTEKLHAEAEVRAKEAAFESIRPQIRRSWDSTRHWKIRFAAA